MESWVVATGLIFAYIFVTVVLGFLANRALAVDLEDFLLYGRQAGFVVLYLTVVASYHSAFAFLGSGGFFYTHGIGFWEAGTWTVLVGAITYTLGVRIWVLGKRFGYMTPADMLADFYESETVRAVAAAVSVLFTILYIQVQAQGLGYIISVASGDRISFEVGRSFCLLWPPDTSWPAGYGPSTGPTCCRARGCTWPCGRVRSCSPSACSGARSRFGAGWRRRALTF